MWVNRLSSKSKHLTQLSIGAPRAPMEIFDTARQLPDPDSCQTMSPACSTSQLCVLLMQGQWLALVVATCVVPDCRSRQGFPV
jgi:hypothetical protein